MSTVITAVPVTAMCRANGPFPRAGTKKSAAPWLTCPGVMFIQTLSRLEEGLGHEGFQCDTCGRKIKYVPGGAR